MPAPFRYRTCLLALCCGLSFSAIAASTTSIGQYANQQTRQIASLFPGRMAGSPAELMAAEYINQHLKRLGYQSDTRQQNTAYRWQPQSGEPVLQKVTATSVIAAKNGLLPGEIVIMAHLDTRIPENTRQQQQDIGGLRLQGVDNNAAALGVMLELAKQLSNDRLRYGIRFVALSATENSMQGMENYLSRMSDNERQNTRLVINLDELIAGKRLDFVSGVKTSATEQADTAGKALAIAHRLGIPAHATRLSGADNREATPFDKAGLPYLLVTADSDGHRRQATLLGDLTDRDNLEYIDQRMPGRLAKRSREVVSILLPFIRQMNTTAG